MALSPVPPAGVWRYSCTSTGRRLNVAFWVLFVPLGLCAVFGRVTHGGLLILDAVAGGALLVVVVVRASRMGVWADADRVVIRNLWFTHELNWADVSRIEAYGWRQLNRGAKSWIFRMRDGHGVSASVLLPYFGASDAVHDLLVTAPRGVEFSNA